MITVLVGTRISWMQVQGAAHSHIPAEKLMGSAPFGPAHLSSWLNVASYTTSQSGKWMEKVDTREIWTCNRRQPYRQLSRRAVSPKTHPCFSLLRPIPLPHLLSLLSLQSPHSPFSIKISQSLRSVYDFCGLLGNCPTREELCPEFPFY